MIFDGRRPASNPFAAALAALNEGDEPDTGKPSGGRVGIVRHPGAASAGAPVRRAGPAAGNCVCPGRSARAPVRPVRGAK